MANLTSNTASLQEILAKVNALPEAGGGGGPSGGGTATVTITSDDTVTVYVILYSDGEEWKARYPDYGIVNVNIAVEIGTVVFVHYYGIFEPIRSTTGAVELGYDNEEYAVLKVNGEGALSLHK